MDDELLTGGVNQVWRSGSTVIRPAGAHTPSVHRLLRHLRDRGFDSAPEVLRLDIAAGTETLSFLAGETTGYPMRDIFRSDRALTSAARLLRAYHDATVDFEVEPSDRWYLPAREPGEVICHGDYAPYNCVVQAGEVTGVFDFDTAHPAPRLWDVSYAAYRWAPLTGRREEPSNNDGLTDLGEQRRRLHLFCDEYGTDDVVGVLAHAVDRLAALVATMRDFAASGNEAFAAHIEDGHDELYLTDRAYLIANQARLA